MALKFQWWILIFTIYCTNFYSSCSEEKKEIKLTIFKDRGGVQCKGEQLSVEVGEEFRVYVTYEGSMVYSPASCYESLESNKLMSLVFSKESPQKRQGYTSSREFFITANFFGEWNYSCEFCTSTSLMKGTTCHNKAEDGYDRADARVTCRAKVLVHNPGEIVVKPSGYLTANGVNFTEAYRFYAGEGTDFTCHKTTGSKVRLSYITTDGSEKYSTDFQQTDSVSMYMKLEASNFGAVLKCVIVDDRGQDLNIGLKLTEISDRQNLLTFQVNDMILPVTETINGNEYHFEYKYYHGEIVTVRDVKSDAEYGVVSCSVEGPNVPVNLTNYFNGISKTLGSIVFIIGEKETGTYLSCTVQNLGLKTEYHLKLTFKFHTLEYSPYLTGLAMSNILLQYSNNTSNIIEYGVRPDETLNLDCIHPPGLHYTWLYSSTEVITMDKTIEIKPRPFQLQLSQKSANIRCQETPESSKRTTYLTLQRIDPTTTPAPTNIPVFTPGGTTSTRNTPPVSTRPRVPSTPDLTAEGTTEGITSAGNAPNYSTTPEVPPATEASSPTTPAPTTLHPPGTEKGREGRVINLTTRGPNQQTTTKKTTTKKPTTKKPTWKKPTKKKPTKKKPTKKKPTTKTTTKNVTPAFTPNPQDSTVVVNQPPKTSKSTVNLTTDISVTDETSTIPTVIKENMVVNTSATSNTSTIENVTAGTVTGISWVFVVSAIIVITIVVPIVFWIACKRKKQSSANMDYQNLPRHREGPMVTPPQWDRSDNALYADPNAPENLYAKPVPKSQRIKTEPTYADPRDSISHHTYLNSQQISNEYTYASVQNNDPTYASVQNNDPTYASVQNNDPTYASVQNNDPTYAAVQNNEPTYASVQKSGNAPSKTEPTYANQNSLEYQNLSTLKKENTCGDVTPKKTPKRKDAESSQSHYQNQKKKSADVIYSDVFTELRGNNKYVNANVKNNVEPAYSEITKK